MSGAYSEGPLILSLLNHVDVPNPQVVLETKRDEIARFIHVVSPLAKVYNLPMSSLHIFYDLGGGLIAFNRNASIFLNLRYFEAWRMCLLVLSPFDIEELAL